MVSIQFLLFIVDILRFVLPFIPLLVLLHLILTGSYLR